MNNDAKRLANAVILRRQELGLSQRDVWNLGGPSNSTLTNVERGDAEVVSSKTLGKLDRALGWVPGSASTIFRDGGSPTPLVEDRHVRDWDSPADANSTATVASLNELDGLREAMRSIATDDQGAVAKIVRSSAAEFLPEVIQQLDDTRRARVLHLAFELLDEVSSVPVSADSYGEQSKQQGSSGGPAASPDPNSGSGIGRAARHEEGA